MALGGWPGLVGNSKGFEPPVLGMFTLLGHGDVPCRWVQVGQGQSRCAAPNSAAALALQAEPSSAPLPVPFCQPWAPRGEPSSALWGLWGQGNNKDQAPGETNHFVRKEHKKDKRDAACSGERANPCELPLQGAGLTLHLAQALPQRVPVPCTESRNRGL